MRYRVVCGRQELYWASVCLVVVLVKRNELSCEICHRWL